MLERMNPCRAIQVEKDTHSVEKSCGGGAANPNCNHAIDCHSAYCLLDLHIA